MEKLIVLTGPTATGKTRLAALLATKMNGEIISADSRQVYRGMDLGTGKDLADYVVNGVQVPFHCIDIVDAGHKYNLYQYQRDFIDAYNDIVHRQKTPILCGGSGLYVESVINGYKMVHVPANMNFRQECEKKSYIELVDELKKYKRLHNTTDIDTKQRLIRALEIEVFYNNHPEIDHDFPSFESIILVVDIERDSRRKKISTRLKERMNEGMIDEINTLLQSGIDPESLIYYGLEYKFVTQYVIGDISYEDMMEKLEIAIHQFAKRQMTWFRGMERRGLTLHWIDGNKNMDDRLEDAYSLLKEHGFA